MTDKHFDPYRLTSLLAGIAFFVVGLVMVFLGISAEGMIDVQGAVFSGKITTGSAGLFVLFFAFLIIITALVVSFPRARVESAPTSIHPMFKKAMIVFVLLLAATIGLALVATFMPEGKGQGLGIVAAGFGFMTFLALVAVLVAIEEDSKGRR